MEVQGCGYTGEYPPYERVPSFLAFIFLVVSTVVICVPMAFVVAAVAVLLEALWASVLKSKSKYQQLEQDEGNEESKEESKEQDEGKEESKEESKEQDEGKQESKEESKEQSKGESGGGWMAALMLMLIVIPSFLLAVWLTSWMLAPTPIVKEFTAA